MRITQINIQGQRNWSTFAIEEIEPQLSVFFGPPRSGKSTLSQLAGHLLFGKTGSSWRPYEEHVLQEIGGSVSVENLGKQYVLRRQFEKNQTTPQLTISAVHGSQTDSDTIRELLGGLKSQHTQQLFSVDFSESPSIHSLLDNPAIQELIAPQNKRIRPQQLPESCRHELSDSDWTNRIDRRRLDELVHQRDAIARELENEVGLRRHESGVLENELLELDAELQAKRQHLQSLEADLHALDARIAELEARIRFSHPEHYLDLKQDELSPHAIEGELKELDIQIDSCRDSLEKFQSREISVRNELAKISPDGTANQVTCITDSRTSLSVLERLLDDLDSEISQLARSHDPGRCLGLDSHGRLSPVAKMLRQQVYALCGNLTEQERHNRRQQLLAELRQLERLQKGIGEELNLLNAQRESLILNFAQTGQKKVPLPQTPVREHCRCDSHLPFLQELESLSLNSDEHDWPEGNAQDYLRQLHLERTAFMDQLEALRGQIATHEQRWSELQNQRAQLIGSTVTRAKQAELERLEDLIQGLLQSESSSVRLPLGKRWSASDVLAQLSNGQLVQIRIPLQDRTIWIIDSSGKKIALENLSSSQHDQLYLALTLALVNNYANQGVHLPLILDEPFLRQDNQSAAVMAGVLEEFARSGHQLLVFTEDREAERTFQSLGATVHNLEKLRYTSAPKPPVPERLPVEVQTTTKRRVVRKGREGQHDTILRIAELDTENLEDVFFLHDSSPWEDFPILGSETAVLFGLIDIQSVGDLLIADPIEIASRLSQPDITTETVRLWQSHIALMCFVPEMTLQDAQVITAVGILAPDELADCDLDQITSAVVEFLSSQRGKSLTSTPHRYGRSQFGRWREGARRNLQRWYRTRRSTTPRQPKYRTGAQPETKNRLVRKKSENGIKKRKRRFSLGRQDDIEAAPSIGPKTASRFSQVGIRTVADFLNANAEATAEELNVSHITSKLIATWQQQTRLVCQIPELPGYGAQLLVATGFTEPEQIADTSRDTLVAKILEFCQTKKGQRILRSSEAPEAEKIAAWIESAAHSRPVDAA